MTTTVTRTTAILAVTLAGYLASPETVAAAPPHVESVFPPAQLVNIPANAVISVTFDEPIDPATVNAITFRSFGRWSGPAGGSYVVTDNVITFTPSEPFFAGEWVTVSLSKGIESMNGQGLAKGYAWNFWIVTATTLLNLDYVGRISTREHNETVTSYGAYAGDLDNDGWGDLTVINETTNDARVFMNNAGTFDGSFTIETMVGTATPSPNEMGDFNNDGEIDLVVGSVQTNQISLLFGDGTGDFTDGLKTSYTTAGVSSNSRGVGVLDLNGDGWDDIVSASRSTTNNISIFLNNCDGTFAAAVAKETGGNGETSIAVADANNDGLLDVFCGTFNSPQVVIVLLSDGNGGLTAQPPVACGGRAWQIIAGDFNNDGNVDIAADNTYESRMAVMLGNGLGGLAAPAYYAVGSFPLAIDAGDLDGDGDLELVSSDYDSGTWTLYENSGGIFVNPQTLNSSSSGSCATLHDRDNDGDLDMTGIDEIDDWIYFFDNNDPVTAVTPAAASMTLFQNYPNPFNPTTTIAFALTKSTRVELVVFDAAGARVAELANGVHPAGETDVNWNGTDLHGNRVGSGVYFYRLVSGTNVLTRKMVLLK